MRTYFTDPPECPCHPLRITSKHKISLNVWNQEIPIGVKSPRSIAILISRSFFSEWHKFFMYMGKISIQHVTIFLSKYISKGAVDITFSPDVGNKPSNPFRNGITEGKSIEHAYWNVFNTSYKSLCWLWQLQDASFMEKLVTCIAQVWFWPILPPKHKRSSNVEGSVGLFSDLYFFLLIF